jgi:hypothetical protein
MAVDVSTIALQVILYSFGPFFGYPWKPILNAFGGSSYTVGYKHFWAQHQDLFNLLWHAVCMIFQLSGNFLLLQALDNYFFNGSRYLAKATAVIWSLYLGSCKYSPPIARLLSALSIAIAFAVVPYLSISEVEKFVVVSFAFIWIIQLMTQGLSINVESLSVVGLLLFKYIIGLQLTPMIGIYSSYTKEIVVCYCISISLLSLRLDAVKVVIVLASLSGQILSILTSNPILYLHSSAFTAMLFQGLAHALSKETATLVKLMDETSQRSKVEYEWAHVTYFPNLMYHALYDTYQIKRNKTKRKE